DADAGPCRQCPCRPGQARPQPGSPEFEVAQRPACRAPAYPRRELARASETSPPVPPPPGALAPSACELLQAARENRRRLLPGYDRSRGLLRATAPLVIRRSSLNRSLTPGQGSALAPNLRLAPQRKPDYLSVGPGHSAAVRSRR